MGLTRHISEDIVLPFFVTVKTCLWQIRAKEAAKTQAALTRDPKEDKKTDMMERLPTLIRCLRTYPLPLV